MPKLEDVEKQIEDGFKSLEEQQEARKKEQDAEIENLKRRLLAADSATQALVEKIQSQDKWISEVEAKQNTARFGGNQAGDGLLAGIPQEYRKQVEIAKRHNYDDPILKTAQCLWWHFQFMAMKARRERTPHTLAEYFDMSDKLERAWGFDPVLKTAIAEGTGGGLNIIATPVEAELWRVIRDNSVIRPLATKLVMSSLTHQIPVENANVSAFIVPDTGTISDSMPTTTFAQQALTAKQFAGLATVSNAVFQDTIIGLNDYLFTAIGEAIGILEDQGALDGINFTGIAVAPGVNTMFVSGTVTSGGNIPTYADWVSLVYLAQQMSTRKNAAFFCLPNVTKNAISLVDTTGQPILKFGNATEPWQGSVIGYPVYEVSSLKTTQSDVGQGGTNFSSSTRLYFGPPNKLLYGDISGMTFEIDPYGLFTTVQSRVRVLKRTAILAPRGGFFSYMVGVKYV